MALGKPNILIPLPESAQNHQVKNAMYFFNKGTSILIEELNLEIHLLEDKILALLNDNLMKMRMSRAALSLAAPNAARKISEEILKIAKAPE